MMRATLSLMLLTCVSCMDAQAGYSRSNCANIYLADNASETTVSVQNTWYTIAGTWAENSLSGWTRAGGVLTSPVVGGGAEYFMVWSASLSAVAEDDFEVAMFHGGVRVEAPGKVEVSKNGKAHMGGGHCKTLLDDVDVELKIRNTSNTGNVTVVHASMAMHRI